VGLHDIDFTRLSDCIRLVRVFGNTSAFGCGFAFAVGLFNLLVVKSVLIACCENIERDLRGRHVLGGLGGWVAFDAGLQDGMCVHPPFQPQLAPPSNRLFLCFDLGHVLFNLIGLLPYSLLMLKALRFQSLSELVRIS
jgi:hypothetical protein